MNGVNMNRYVDKWGRYHDKPVINGVPSSNNGWIYTAYAAKGGLEIDKLPLAMCFRKCKLIDESLPKNLRLIRSPAKELPPISRDEILGMAALGFLKEDHLNGWNFSPYPIPKFSLIKFVKQLFEIRNKHRNYLWQNNMNQVYRLAFSVPIADRHFILSCWGKFNIFYYLIAKVDSLLFKPTNGIHWLKYGGDERKAIMKTEFPSDHPLQGV
jgi:hypothetical protein